MATLTGLTDSTAYTVRVIATNAKGDSGASNEATGADGLPAITPLVTKSDGPPAAGTEEP